MGIQIQKLIIEFRNQSYKLNDNDDINDLIIVMMESLNHNGETSYHYTHGSKK